MEQLGARKRTVFGKRLRTLRKEGLVPAVVYGGTTKEAQALALDERDFMRVWKGAGESTIISLSIEGDRPHNVLIHDVARDPVEDKLLHVDFYEISKDQKIKVHVPFTFEGESPAVKSLGGVLVKVMHEVEVEALPENLPHEIQIDINGLATFEDHILVKDISFPKNVEVVGDAEAMVVKVDPPRSEEELSQLTETPEVSLEDIEIVKKGKDEEEKEPGEEAPREGE